MNTCGTSLFTTGALFGLVFLAGGVTETTGSGINDNYPSGTNFVSNGQRNATAQVSIDGSPLSAPEQGEGGNSNVYYQPSVEIVQEFKLQNNSFSAEFGNNGGTVVNIVLKQGTNQFHGSGWWYGQRSAFDARDFFNTWRKTRSRPRPIRLRGGRAHHQEPYVLLRGFRKNPATGSRQH